MKCSNPTRQICIFYIVNSYEQCQTFLGDRIIGVHLKKFYDSVMSWIIPNKQEQIYTNNLKCAISLKKLSMKVNPASSRKKNKYTLQPQIKLQLASNNVHNESF